MGRVTFHSAQSEVCHQRIVRDRVAARPDADILFPPPESIILKRARVRPIGRAIAWKVISRYEWLGTLPAGCSMFFGAMFDDRCGGVACFQSSVGAGNAVAKMYRLEQPDIAYLCRGACVHWAPTGTAPKLINFASELTGRKIAIAYSDTDAGEIGTVYQAAGWACLGQLGVKYEWVSPKGRVMNRALGRQVANKNGISFAAAEAELIRAGWRKQPDNPKIRYVKILKKGRTDADLVRRIETMRVSYPKRVSAGSIDRDAPGDQPGEGGASPTSALQTKADS